jgi:hypothetical protein
MQKEFGDAPFFSPAPLARSSSLQPAVVSCELHTSTSGVGVLLEAAPLQGGQTGFVKNYSTVDKSSSRQAISPLSQIMRHSLKQWIDIHDDDEQALLQVFPSNFDPESIFS